MHYLDWYRVLNSFDWLLIASLATSVCLAFVLRYYFRVNIRLRAARQARGWSIERAAEEVGVDTSTYHRWELGKQQPHPNNIYMLQNTFKMDARDLGYELRELSWKVTLAERDLALVTREFDKYKRRAGEM